MRLALAWTGLLLVLLFMPSEWIVSPPDGGAFVGHVVLFGVSGVLWARAFPNRQRAILVALVVLAFATELGQGLAWIGRGSQPKDLVADAVGIGLAWIVLQAMPRPEPQA